VVVFLAFRYAALALALALRVVALLTSLIFTKFDFRQLIRPVESPN